ncbi:MAG TPA: hypothetical protein VIT64_16250 [Ilumatobacteraceae bacterium]
MALSEHAFDVTVLLEREAGAIVDDAAAALERSHLAHYEEAGTDERRRRVQSLFDVVLTSLRQRDLVPIHGYAEAVARERFEAGVSIAELQTAFNVLEEALWQRVVSATDAGDLADAIGVVATVLGAGKDSLARTYVELATARHVPSLDLTALFRGGN